MKPAKKEEGSDFQVSLEAYLAEFCEQVLASVDEQLEVAFAEALEKHRL